MIHIVSVPGIKAGRETKGIACLPFIEDWSTPVAVILIDSDEQDQMTLAHELGHVLGLNSKGDNELGHPSPSRMGDCTNIMIPCQKTDCPYPRGYFSLGQVFRMNFLDEVSWLSSRNDLIKPGLCQREHVSDLPCPSMFADLVQWTPGGIP